MTGKLLLYQSTKLLTNQFFLFLYILLYEHFETVIKIRIFFSIWYKKYNNHKFI